MADWMSGSKSTIFSLTVFSPSCKSFEVAMWVSMNKIYEWKEGLYCLGSVAELKNSFSQIEQDLYVIWQSFIVQGSMGKSKYIVS